MPDNRLKGLRNKVKGLKYVGFIEKRNRKQY